MRDYARDHPAGSGERSGGLTVSRRFSRVPAGRDLPAAGPAPAGGPRLRHPITIHPTAGPRIRLHVATARSGLLAGCLLLPAATLGDETGEAAVGLDPVHVTAPDPGRDLMRTPAAVGAVEAPDLRQGRQGLQLDESLSRIPGVLFQNRYNFAQNLRISIRGFGARAPFGVRGIRLRVDGLPETLPDGQSQVDAIDLESISRVELIRGPAAAVYGNAAGGVIDIRTADRIGTGHTLELRSLGGSDGFRRYGLRAGAETAPWRGHVSAWQLDHDGYRAQSDTRKRMVHARLLHEGSAGRSLTALVTALDQPFGKDPGGLTRAEAAADRRMAAPNALTLDAGQRVRQQRIGLVLRDETTFPGEIDAYAFYTRREFGQQLPFPGTSLIGYERDFVGAGAGYSGRARFLRRPLLYAVGVEVHHQRDDRQRFGVDGDGNIVAQRQDALESATASGVRGQIDHALTERLDLTLGARIDLIRFSIDDRFTATGAASGGRSYDESSFMAGLGWQWRPSHRLYANVGSAFETPTFTEFLDPDAPEQGFDPDLEPQRAVNVEAGIKGSIGSRLGYDLALFTIRTRDEIVQVGTDPNRFANAARTRRAGLELGLEYRLDEAWTVTGAWTASHFRFDRFSNAEGTSLDGNRMPGLPVHALFGELAWRGGEGRWAVVDLLLIGSRYADNENAVDVAGHTIANLRAGREFDLGAWRMEYFVAVNNLTDREWFANLRVNAAGGRYFEPAPGRNWYAGIGARY